MERKVNQVSTDRKVEKETRVTLEIQVRPDLKVKLVQNEREKRASKVTVMIF